jgi:hypothetical protein
MAAGTVRRTIKNGGTIDQGGMGSVEHNAYSGSRKMLTVGPEFYPTTGQLANATAVTVPIGSIVGLYNNSSSVAWASLAFDTAPTAPTSFSNAIPLTPNSWTWINSGSNNMIMTSTATVGVYTIKDDATYQFVPVP